MADFKFTALVNLQLASGAIKGLVDNVRSALRGASAEVGVKVSSDSVSGLRRLNTEITSVSSAARAMGAATSASTTGLTKMRTEARGAADSFSILEKSMVGTIARIATFGTSLTVLHRFATLLGDSVRHALQFERSLIRVAQVQSNSIASVRGISNEVTRLSTAYGVSANHLLESARSLRQAGLSFKDVETSLQAIAKADLSGNFSTMERTVSGSISVMRQFGIEAKDLEKSLSSINEVAGRFGTSADDVLEAVKRVGAVFKTAGGDINEVIALFASVKGVTREPTESVATGLRTIFARIQKPEILNQLKALGVELRTTREEATRMGDAGLTGTFVGPLQAVTRLSQALSRLRGNDPRFIGVAEQLGGTRQVEKILPLLQNATRAQEAYNVAVYGSGSLTRAAAQAQDSFVQKLSRVRQEFDALIRKVTESNGFKAFADNMIRLTEGAITLGNALRPLVPLVAAFTAGRLASGAGSLVGGGIRKILGFAEGGVVPGVGNTDSVPANLMPGEFVLRKPVAQAIGYNRLQAMNTGGRVGYATGGSVTLTKPLDPHESNAVDDYAGANYIEINRFLRKKGGLYGTSINKEEVKKTIKELTNAVAKGRLGKDVVLHRGVNTQGLEAIEKLIGTSAYSTSAIGKAFTDKGFVSTSTDPSVPARFGKHKFIIHGKEGRAALSLNDVGLGGGGIGDENEILLQHGSKFRIIGHQEGKIVLQQLATGGYVNNGGSFGFARGGSVPAMLTPGEFVFGRSAVNSIGVNNLRGLNSGVRRYADGGFVGPLQFTPEDAARTLLENKGYIQAIINNPKYAGFAKAAGLNTEESVYGKAFEILQSYNPNVRTKTGRPIHPLQYAGKGLTKYIVRQGLASEQVGVSGLVDKGQVIRQTGDEAVAIAKIDARERARYEALQEHVHDLTPEEITAQVRAELGLPEAPPAFEIAKKATGSSLNTRAAMTAKGSMMSFRRRMRGESLAAQTTVQPNVSAAYIPPVAVGGGDAGIPPNLPPAPPGPPEPDPYEDWRRLITSRYGPRGKKRRPIPPSGLSTQTLSLPELPQAAQAAGLSAQAFSDLVSEIRKAAQSGKRVHDLLDSSTKVLVEFQGDVAQLRGFVGGKTTFGIAGPSRQIGQRVTRAQRRAARTPSERLAETFGLVSDVVDTRAPQQSIGYAFAPEMQHFDTIPILPGGRRPEFARRFLPIGHNQNPPLPIGLQQEFPTPLEVLPLGHDQTERDLLNRRRERLRVRDIAAYDLLPASYQPSSRVRGGGVERALLGDFRRQSLSRLLGAREESAIGAAGGANLLSERSQIALREKERLRLQEELTAVTADQIRRSKRGISVQEARLQAEEQVTAAFSLLGKDTKALTEAERELVRVVLNAKGELVGLAGNSKQLAAQGLAVERTPGRLEGLLGRLGLGGIGRRLALNGRLDIGQLYALSAVASYAGAGAESLGGTAQEAVQGNRTGRFTTGRAVGGILGGASTGAIFGSQLLPGYGTAIGAGVGAVYGAYSSIKDAQKELQDVRIDLASREVSDRVNDLANRRGTPDAASLVAIRESLRKTRQELGARSTEQASTFLGGLNTADYSSFQKAGLQNQLGAALPGIATILRANATELGKNSQGAGKSLQQFQGEFLSGAGGFNREMVHLISTIKGIGLTEVLKDFAKTALEAANAEKARLKEEEASGGINRSLNTLQRVVSNIESATLGTEGRRAHIATLHDIATGGLGAAQLSDLAAHVSNTGNPNAAEFAQSLQTLSRPLGVGGQQFVQTGTALNQLKPVLSVALANVLSQEFGEETSFGARIGEQLGGLLPGAGKNDTLSRLINQVTSRVDLEPAERLRKEAVTDVSRLAERLLEPADAPFRQFSAQAGKALQDNATFFTTELARIAKATHALVPLFERAEQEGLQVERRRAVISSIQAGRRGDVGAFLSLTALERPFNTTQERLAREGGVLGGGAFSAEALGAALRRAQGQIPGLEQRVNLVRARTGGQGKEFEDIVKQFTAVKSQASFLEQALKHLGDAASRSAGVQEKLAALESDRTSRLSFGQRVLTSDSASLSRLNRGLLLAGIAQQNGGRLENFGLRDRRAIYESLGALGEARLPALGGVKASDLVRQFTERSLGGAFAQTPEDQRKEASLQDTLLKYAQESQKSSSELAQTMSSFPKQLLDALLLQQKDFFDRLGKQNKEFQFESGQAGLVQEALKLGSKRDLKKRADYLSLFGITDDTQIASVKANEGSLNDFLVKSQRLGQYQRTALSEDQAGQISDILFQNFFAKGGRAKSQEEIERKTRELIPNLPTGDENELASYIVGRTHAHDFRRGVNKEEIQRLVKNELVPGFFGQKANTLEEGELTTSRDKLRNAFSLPALIQLQSAASQGAYDPKKFAQAIASFGEKQSLTNLDKEIESTTKAFNLLREPLEKLAKDLGRTIKLPSPEGHAGGGLIGGQYTGVDTIPAMLTAGEFVVKRDVAQRYKGMLHQLNQTGRLPSFHDGNMSIVASLAGKHRSAYGSDDIGRVLGGAGERGALSPFGYDGQMGIRHYAFGGFVDDAMDFATKAHDEAYKIARKEFYQGGLEPGKGKGKERSKLSLKEKEKYDKDLVRATNIARRDFEKNFEDEDGLGGRVLTDRGRKQLQIQLEGETVKGIENLEKAEKEGRLSSEQIGRLRVLREKQGSYLQDRVRAGEADERKLTEGQQRILGDYTAAQTAKEFAGAQGRRKLAFDLDLKNNKTLKLGQKEFEDYIKENKDNLTASELGKLRGAYQAGQVHKFEDEETKTQRLLEQTARLNPGSASAVLLEAQRKQFELNRGVGAGHKAVLNEVAKDPLAQQKLAFASGLYDLRRAQSLAHRGTFTGFGFSRPGENLGIGISLSTYQQRLAGNKDNNRDYEQSANYFLGKKHEFGQNSLVNIVKPQHFATGGIVPGFGTGDTIPAMLTPGEGVLTRTAVRGLGGARGLAAIQHFAEGGVVGTTSGLNLGQGSLSQPSSVSVSAAANKELEDSAKIIQASFSRFEPVAKALTEAMKAFPSSIDLKGVNEVHVTLNGAEVLGKLTPLIQSMVADKVTEGISREFKKRLPDA